MTQSSANSRQVGGSHYSQAGATQHWDYAVANGLGYLEGQVSKYITRWPHKHPTLKGKLDDLGKAGHFLDKLVEVARVGHASPVQTHISTRMPQPIPAAIYAMQHNMGLRELAIMVGLEQWAESGDIEKLVNARTLVDELLEAAPAAHAEDGSEPGSGYVKQD